MSAKYADLAEKIYQNDRLGIVTGQAKRILSWLDEHPESCPGRTISEGELWGIFERRLGTDAWRGLYTPLRQIVDDLGITVVPDLKMAMAKRLDSDIQEVDQHLTSRQLAEALIERGWVKAEDDDGAR